MRPSLYMEAVFLYVCHLCFRYISDFDSNRINSIWPLAVNVEVVRVAGSSRTTDVGRLVRKSQMRK